MFNLCFLVVKAKSDKSRFVYNLLENNIAFISLNTIDKSNPLSFGLNLIILFPREVM
jgi:hypothetical protein